MAVCYSITYSDRFGTHSGTKWADSPEDALRLLKKSHGGKKSRGSVEYGKPVALAIQPFTDESRAANALFWGAASETQTPVAAVDTFETDDDPTLLTAEHDDDSESEAVPASVAQPGFSGTRKSKPADGRPMGTILQFQPEMLAADGQ